MAKLSVTMSPKPKKENKRKLSASVAESPQPLSGKKSKKSKNIIKNSDGPTLVDQELGDHDFSALLSPEKESPEPKKGKRKLSESMSESPKTLNVVKKLKVKKAKVEKNDSVVAEAAPDVAEEKSKGGLTMEQVLEKYPVLKDEELVKKFLAVPISNNQKGRIRQRLRDYLKGGGDESDPGVISARLTAALDKGELGDSDLRKIRVLFNMLKTATQKLMEPKKTKKSRKKKKNKKSKDAEKKDQKEVAEEEAGEDNDKESDEESEDDNDEAESKADDDESEAGDDESENDEVKEDSAEKSAGKPSKKGPKRYVVFVGNLPYDVDKDGILRHFSSLVGGIKDVRIPGKGENRKGGIAYLELNDEPSYQMALSQHHTMLGNRRINVLYSATGKGKVDKNEAKSKTAKLVALQKSGQLLGSTPLNRKRSARRKKQREAEAKKKSQE